MQNVNRPEVKAIGKASYWVAQPVRASSGNQIFLTLWAQVGIHGVLYQSNYGFSFAFYAENLKGCKR